MLRLYAKLFTFLFLLCILSSCENDINEVNKTLNTQLTSVERAENIVLNYSDSALLKVQISGPELLRYIGDPKIKEEFPKGIRVEFYNESQEAYSWLTSKYAIRYHDRKEIIAKDSVVFFTAKKDTIKTSELIWDEQNGLVKTDKFVRISNPERIILGYGFSTNEDFTVYTINSIEGEIDVSALEKELDDLDQSKPKIDSQ